MSKKQPEGLKWEVRQRLSLLEATLVWTGELTTQTLTKAFGISRVQASTDFSTYREICPGNLDYDKSRRRYFASDTFKPVFIQGTPDEYVRLLKLSNSDENTADTDSDVLVQLPSVTWIERMGQYVNFPVISRLTRAIRSQKVVKLTYKSMSKDTPYELEFSPHTLVYNGFRWHVRGFSEKHQGYRDFVLTRISEVTSSEHETPYHGNSDDEPWHEYVQIIISPNPRLSRHQQEIIAEDYDMKNMERKIRLRAAMVPYYIRLMNIGLHDENEDVNPMNQLIVLKNKRELKSYITF